MGVVSVTKIQNTIKREKEIAKHRENRGKTVLNSSHQLKFRSEDKKKSNSIDMEFMKFFSTTG